MRPPDTTSRAWLSLLLLAFLMQVPSAACQESLPPYSHLSADVRSQLVEASGDSQLEPWQREFMLEAARGSPARPVGVAGDDGVWTPISWPRGRRVQTAIYDPVRDRMVVFGGLDSGGPLNDVWVLTLEGTPAWSELTPAGTPPSERFGHTAIYDPVRDRMVVFGGYSGGSLNDVWELTLASPAWNELSPVGSLSPGRFVHSAIYDPVRDRMVVFGGLGSGGPLNNVWALTLAESPAWTELIPAGNPPSARDQHTAIYDPVRDRMVVFGGVYASLLNDVWALSLAGSPAWSVLAPAGPPPSGRSQHTAIYDSVGDRMVVFAGADPGGPLNEVWALTLAGSGSWSLLSPAGSPPSAREYPSAIYDPMRDRMVVFGGYPPGGELNDAWALTLTGPLAWSTLAPAVDPPIARYSHAGIHDLLHDRMLVFGGYSDTYMNDLSALTLAGSPTWSPVATMGHPAPRAYHTSIYDPVRGRMLMFGGLSVIGPQNDLWALTLTGNAIWSNSSPPGTPPSARYAHAAFYDPVRDRMVVFGGRNAGSWNNEVWALSLAGSPTWGALTPTGTPPSARYSHTAIHDPVRDRMVVFGGLDSGGLLNEVWQLTLAGTPAWSALAPTATPPVARHYHSAVYDAVRDRMVVFGGSDGGQFRNDVWALTLAGSPAWSELSPTGTPPSPRAYHSSFYDFIRDRMVVFGGYDVGPRNDVWNLAWSSAVSVAQSTTTRLQLAAPRPNPSRGVTFVDFDLAEPGRVVMDVIDVHGRLVKRIADGWYPAGRHASMWRGDDSRGIRSRSGVYFIVMQGEGYQATRRTVRVTD